MNVLVACEESQEVCKAFRALGHTAYSCDVQDCSGGHPEWHIKGNVLPLINGDCTFRTADTHTHTTWTMGYDNRFPAVHLHDKCWGGAHEGKGRDRAGEIRKSYGGERVFYEIL